MESDFSKLRPLISELIGLPDASLRKLRDWERGADDSRALGPKRC